MNKSNPTALAEMVLVRVGNAGNHFRLLEKNTGKLLASLYAETEFAALIVHRVNNWDKLVEALDCLYKETADYITINHLGDVHHNQSMKLARDALALAKEGV